MRRSDTFHRTTWDIVILVIAAILAMAVLFWATPVNAAPLEDPQPEVPRLHTVVSPWDGVYRNTDDFGETPLVEVGSRVVPESIVAAIYIDVLLPPKHFEVPAGVRGSVVEIFIEDGNPVQAGQPLMVIQVDPPVAFP